MFVFRKRLLIRAGGAWVPLVSPIAGAINSNIDVHRAHRAAEAVVAESG